MIDLNLENIPTGGKAKTRKCFVWTHIANDSWKDETSGLIWLPKENGLYNHYQALEKETETNKIPTKKELEEAEKHGIREIFNMECKWFWSASVHPSFSYYAYGFSGDSGVIDFFSRGSYDGSVRCVAGR